MDHGKIIDALPLLKRLIPRRVSVLTCLLHHCYMEFRKQIQFVHVSLNSWFSCDVAIFEN